MLEQTFCHVPGIGADAERSLWRQGCSSWADYLGRPGDWSIGSADPDDAARVLERSVEALAAREHQYFERALGMREAWRAWPEFRDRCVYLDIETDGGQSGDSVTCVGLYDGDEFQCLVQGEDLGSLPDVLSRYGMVVTFFGSGFDIPMLKRAFRNLNVDQIHLDLCPTLRRLGLRGGLKKIERQLGIARGEETDGLTGLDAVRLWRAYQRGNDGALKTLIEYNREDVVNLERLAEIAYRDLRAMTLVGSPVG